MKSFVKIVLATVVGMVLFFILLFFFFASVGSSFSKPEIVEVKKNSVLMIDLTNPILENPPENPFEGLDMFPGASQKILSLVKIKQSIKRAKNDENIKGIYLKMGVQGHGFAIAEEVRSEIEQFRETGKWVVAYGELYSELAYYIASEANSVYLHPEGDIEFNGLRTELLFFKGSFEKLDIEPEIFRVGKYKSAIEPFTREDMSEANREQIEAYLASLNAIMLKEVATNRNIEEATIKNISNQMLVRSPDLAKKYQLVDDLKYFDEVEGWIKLQLELGEEDKIEMVSLSDYSAAIQGDNGDYQNDKIAVLIAEGEIVNGEGTRENIGGAKFSRELRKIRKDDKVKAVVLRINSPGGSALASDAIWREVVLTSKEKPVIASMSNVAASGGYYIAMGADSIVAWPNTITGSIGVFGLLFNMEGFFNNKLGITADVAKTGEFSDLLTVTRPLNEQEKEIIQNGVERVYETFTTKAAEGRDVPVENILEVASGRVWTGEQAEVRGLVDVLGGYDDAIAAAAGSAGLQEGKYRVVYYPKEKPIFEEFIENLMSGAKTYLMKEEYGEYAKYLDFVRDISKYQGIQARLPYDIEIN